MAIGRRGQWAAGWLAALGTAAPLVAQQPAVALRYAPALGRWIQLFTQTRGGLVLREINEAGQPVGDSVTADLTSLAGLAYRLRERQGSRAVVELRYDSLRTRARLPGQAWKETSLAGAEASWTVTVGPGLELLEGRPALPADPTAAGGLVTWRGVGLPEQPVAPGDSWSVPAVFRLPPHLGALLEIAVPDSIATIANVRLDSLSVLGADTLAYFTVRESLGPVTLPATDVGDRGTIELAGSQAASLVWSSGWGAYVSAASQARVVGRLQSRSASGPPRLAELAWNLASRLQVRR